MFLPVKNPGTENARTNYIKVTCMNFIISKMKQRINFSCAGRERIFFKIKFVGK